MQPQKKISATIAFLISISALSAWHASAAETVLPAVVVEAERIAATTGATTIDQEMIEALPSRNGSINEIIGIVPGVQFAEGTTSSLTGGEIDPPRISINGSRFYENNYTVDGISNNSSIDPEENGVANVSKLPSLQQKYTLNPRMIEQLTVYDSNIPAEHGEFTGGHIEAKTLDPAPDFQSDAYYRTTRDRWTNFYVDPPDRTDFEESRSRDKQPDFEKHEAGFSFNIPLGSEGGLIASYRQLYSKIPLRHLDATNTQTRKIENFFLKYSLELSGLSRMSITGIYSPTNGGYFLKDFKDSDFELSNRGKAVIFQFDHQANIGTANISLGYSSNKSTREAPLERYLWDTATTSIDWDSGKQGSLGPLETGEQELQLKTAFIFDELPTADINHQLQLGAEVTYLAQYVDRKQTAYYYTKAVVGPVNCNGVSACIDNEQYFNKRFVYEKSRAETEITRTVFYLQDSIAFKRLELFPGIRISYDDYTNNLNKAYRFSTSYDLFGNKNTILFGGHNRYYSGTLLTYKLYASLSPLGLSEKRISVNDEWTESSPGNTKFREGDFKTPYSDERTIGFIQKLLGGELKAQYIERRSKDELARERTEKQPDGFRYYIFNNNGRSKNETYQASWNRSWENHYLELNYTKQTTYTSNNSYDGTVDEDDIAETIWYNDQELYFDEIPRTDFNRPEVANLIYIGRLPYGLSFTNTAKFRGPYYRLKNTAKKKPSSIDPSKNSWIFEKQRQHSSLIFDWRITWEIPTPVIRNAILSLDIYNVFNRKATVGFYRDRFELGRQYWAGLEFDF